MSDEDQSPALALLCRRIDALMDEGRTTVVESLMEIFPSLRTNEELLLACIQAEFRARREHGYAPQIEEYRRRFPRFADRLNALPDGRVQRTGIDQAPAKKTPPPTVKSSLQTIPAASTQLNPQPDAGARPARTFGRYVIEGELGHGAMGVVYLAEDTQVRRKVALKIPHPSSLQQTDALERFYREAHTAGTLHHTNICPVYDFGKIDETHYLAMGYVSGQTLATLIDADQRFTPHQIASLLRKIAWALDYAHQRDITHRDLKPSNIMLDAHGEPIIVDFGLACQLSTPEQVRLTQNGALLGTPAYMSPEQVHGDLELIGPPTDIYSLGVVFYQLLTGRLPFDGPAPPIYFKIQSEEPPPPWEIRPEVNRTLAAICLKMMEKDIARRYAGMKDVAEALAKFLESKAALVEPAPPGKRSGAALQAKANSSSRASAGSHRPSTRWRPHKAKRPEAPPIGVRRPNRWWLIGGVGLLIAASAAILAWWALRP